MKASARRLFCVFLALALAACLLPGASAAPTDNWTDTDNYDASWYDESKSEFHITSAEQLAGLAYIASQGTLEYSTQTFYLDATLDLSAHLWTPIGTNASHFNGTFDGQGNAILGLKTRNTDYSGLFGSNYGTIKNLCIVDCSIVSDYDTVGGVAGYNYGKIENCTVSGNVTGHIYVGGIVGDNLGTVNNCRNAAAVTAESFGGGIAGRLGTNDSAVTGCLNTGDLKGDMKIGGVVGVVAAGSVSSCASSGNVTVIATNAISLSADTQAGGVAGYSASTVTSCYNSGNVSVSPLNPDCVASCVGGVVGEAAGAVAYCFNTGNVTGDTSVGGVVGKSGSDAVSFCYNTGSVTAKTGGVAGGVVGTSGTASIQCCYSLGAILRGSGSTAVTGTSANVKNCYGLEITNAETRLVTYNSSGAATVRAASGPELNTWGFADGYFYDAPTVYADGGFYSASNPVNGGYPVLKAFGYTGLPSDDPTAQFPNSGGKCVVRNSYHLDLLRSANLTGYDFRFARTGDGGYIGGVSLDGLSWKPGNLTVNLDGLGLWVSGLTLSAANADNRGLFANVYSAVENLTVAGGVKGVTHVGGLAATLHSGAVLKNCLNMCSIEGTSYVGGIAGHMSGATVEDCANFGTITQSSGGSCCGGVAGYMADSSSIKECRNLAAAEGVRSVGGIAGYSNASKISRCVNAGGISASAGIGGGIAGQLINSNAEFCLNRGAVSGDVIIGGVVGWAQLASGGEDKQVLRCVNTGSVTARTQAGGVAGLVENNTGSGWSVLLQNCVNFGAVKATANTAGGLAGKLNGLNALIKYSVNLGTVSAPSAFGGIYGANTNGNCSDCYYLGCYGGAGISGSSASADEAGALPLFEFDSPLVNAVANETASLMYNDAYNSVNNAFLLCGLTLDYNIVFNTVTPNTAMGTEAGVDKVKPQTGSYIVAKLTLEDAASPAYTVASLTLILPVTEPVAKLYVCAFKNGTFTSAVPEGVTLVAAKYANGQMTDAMRLKPEGGEYLLSDAAYKIFRLNKTYAPLGDAIVNVG